MTTEPFDIGSIFGDPGKQSELEAEIKKLRDLISDYSARLRRIDEWCGDGSYDVEARTRVHLLVRGAS